MRWRTDQALRGTRCLGVQTTGWVGLAREGQCLDPTRARISCPFTGGSREHRHLGLESPRTAKILCFALPPQDGPGPAANWQPVLHPAISRTQLTHQGTHSLVGHKDSKPDLEPPCTWWKDPVGEWCHYARQPPSPPTTTAVHPGAREAV